jgi:lipopolysaccharide transport system ATP-binding protein
MGIAIKVERLSKEYRLGVINHGMLYKDMQSWFARKLGRPDPHSQIGEDRFADQKDRFWALKDLSFSIEQGDRVGIIGRNGAGKSTLLKILSRITAPTEGSVKIKGKVASLLEVGTGFHPELTGRENVYLNGAILGMKTREIDKKFDEIVEFAEIEKFIDTPVKRYSSGMYVRLAFAVAAHLDSEILLTDEVLAVGDASFQKKALGKMSELSTGLGRTVLFVSHNIPAVQALCKTGIYLSQGKMAFNGEINETITTYMASNIEKGNSILQCATVYDDRIKIGSIEINGNESNRVIVNEHASQFELEIQGESEESFEGAGIELIFRDEFSKPFAYYSPCHFEKKHRIPKGRFSIREVFDLSTLTKGVFYVDFVICIPNSKVLFCAPNSIFIESEGVPTLRRTFHPSSDVGFFVIPPKE